MQEAGVVVGERASHPSRGGWIEIPGFTYSYYDELRPTPHGVGGLKSREIIDLLIAGIGPTPHGVGGLKYV